MTVPQLERSPLEQPDAIKTLTEAFTKLPPLLSYGGLILIAAIVTLSISGALP